MNEFLRAIPWMEILRSLRLFSDKLLHLFFLEKIVTTINGLIAYSYVRNITDGLAPAIDEPVRRVDKVGIHMRGLYRLPIATCYFSFPVIIYL